MIYALTVPCYLQANLGRDPTMTQGPKIQIGRRREIVGGDARDKSKCVMGVGTALWVGKEESWHVPGMMPRPCPLISPSLQEGESLG